MKLKAPGRRMVAVWLLTVPAVLNAQLQFLPLGYLDGLGPTSEANAVTPDGTKVVGYSTTSLTENVACWWTSAGITPIPGYQDWYNNVAYGVSADGNVIVGYRSFGGTEVAWYWTSAGTIQAVPFPAAQSSSVARAVTGDGSVVVGSATSPGSLQVKPFVWKRDQAAAVFLPPYPPSSVPNAGAADVSNDGQRVVGWVQTSLTTQAAARWDGGGTPVLFNQIGDPVIAVSANAITPDGATVVGSGAVVATGKGVGFKWTAAGGVVGLPNPTTGYYAIDGATAIGISGNGRVIVGYGVNVAGDDEAIFWVDGQPYRVSDVAFAAGQLPPSWEPFRAYGVDYTGNVICGYGRATSGKIEAYALIIDATPDPPAIVAPVLVPSFSAAGRTLSIRYPTIPGLRYRVHGGTDILSLAPLGDWSNGLGIERTFTADAAVTGDAPKFFLQVEVAQP